VSVFDTFSWKLHFNFEMACLNLVNSGIAKTGEWALLTLHLPRHEPKTIGILLRDMHTDELHTKLRSNWWTLLREEEGGEAWSAVAEDLKEQARQRGAQAVLEFLETAASHVFQISRRAEIQLSDVQGTLTRLFDQHVGPGQQPWCRSGQCWAVGLLAASFIIVALLAGRFTSRLSLQPPEKLAARVSQGDDLPLALVPYQPVLFVVRQSRHVVHHRGRKQPLSAAPRRCFHIEHAVIRPLPTVRMSELEPPPLELLTPTDEPAILPLSLPDAPRYRRHHWLAKVLSVITTSFRLFT
jgi:hypothetical protein